MSEFILWQYKFSIVIICKIFIATIWVAVGCLPVTITFLPCLQQNTGWRYRALKIFKRDKIFFCRLAMAPGTTAQAFSMLMDCHAHAWNNSPSDLNWPWLYYPCLVYLPIKWIRTVRCKSQTRGRICQDNGNGGWKINEPSQWVNMPDSTSI